MKSKFRFKIGKMPKNPWWLKGSGWGFYVSLGWVAFILSSVRAGPISRSILFEIRY
jgi:hypothetical protein